MKLKVWGVGWMGRSRRIVAATSKKRAAELVGTSLYHFNEYASETANRTEFELAMSKPGTVFEQRCEYSYSYSPWEEINSGASRK